MALHDLLWACPACGGVRTIGADGRCSACDATFARDRGAAIRAVLPDGRVEVKSPAEWVDRLPDPETLLGGGGGPARVARVESRTATGSKAIRGETGYLNRIELYGEPVEGTLELRLDRLIHRPEGSRPTEWPFDALTAVQASSSTLQVKGAGQPLVSFRFTDDSVFLWELLLRAALRAHYRQTGRGEIAEFQPRIVTR